MEPVEITAGRLRLRPWEPADVEVLLEGCNDPLIQQWTRVPTPYTREAAEARLVVARAGRETGTELSWAVCSAEHGKVLAALDLRYLADDTWVGSLVPADLLAG